MMLCVRYIKLFADGGLGQQVGIHTLLSHVTCHMSHVTCHVTCHMSHNTCHIMTQVGIHVAAVYARKDGQSAYT